MTMATGNEKEKRVKQFLCFWNLIFSETEFYPFLHLLRRLTGQFLLKEMKTKIIHLLKASEIYNNVK